MKLNSASIGAILGGVFAITVLLLGSTTCVIIVIVKLVIKKGTIWMLNLLSYRLFIVHTQFGYMYRLNKTWEFEKRLKVRLFIQINDG